MAEDNLRVRQSNVTKCDEVVSRDSVTQEVVDGVNDRLYRDGRHDGEKLDVARIKLGLLDGALREVEEEEARDCERKVNERKPRIDRVIDVKSSESSRICEGRCALTRQHTLSSVHRRCIYL